MILLRVKNERGVGCNADPIGNIQETSKCLREPPDPSEEDKRLPKHGIAILETPRADIEVHNGKIRHGGAP